MFYPEIEILLCEYGIDSWFVNLIIYITQLETKNIIIIIEDLMDIEVYDILEFAEEVALQGSSCSVM